MGVTIPHVWSCRHRRWTESRTLLRGTMRALSTRCWELAFCREGRSHVKRFINSSSNSSSNSSDSTLSSWFWCQGWGRTLGAHLGRCNQGRISRWGHSRRETQIAHASYVRQRRRSVLGILLCCFPNAHTGPGTLPVTQQALVKKLTSVECLATHHEGGPHILQNRQKKEQSRAGVRGLRLGKVCPLASRHKHGGRGSSHS